MISSSLISGWVGGLVGCVVGYPLSTVKTLMQFDPRYYPNAVTTARKVVLENGLHGFYRGCTIPLLNVGAIYSIGFLTYDGAALGIEALRDQYNRERGIVESAAQKDSLCRVVGDACIAGAVSGCFTSAFKGPADLVRIRQQALLKGRWRPQSDASLLNIVRRIYREPGGGLRNFMTGMPAQLLRDVPGSALWFTVYETVRRGYSVDPSHPTVFESLLAGGTAGVVMWTTMMPVDVAKTVQQSTGATVRGTNGKVRPPSLASISQRIYRQRGIRGFYAGVGPAALRAFVANGATFAARDYITSRFNTPAPKVEAPEQFSDPIYDAIPNYVLKS